MFFAMSSENTSDQGINTENGVRSMKESKKRIRVLIAKPGLDGHDRGAKVVVLALREAGMEVIYTGIRQTPETISETALRADVDVVGLSCLSGGHNYLFPKVVRLLAEKGASHILVIGGGIIPEEDIPSLKEAGVKAIFGPGSRTEEIVRCVTSLVLAKGRGNRAALT